METNQTIKVTKTLCFSQLSGSSVASKQSIMSTSVSASVLPIDRVVIGIVEIPMLAASDELTENRQYPLLTGEQSTPGELSRNGGVINFIPADEYILLGTLVVICNVAKEDGNLINPGSR